jgi:hypothetical protein
MNMSSRIVLIAVLAMAGCSKSPSDAASSQINTKAPVAAATEAVAAVLVSGPPTAKLGFVLAAKPVVGASVELRLDFSAVEAVPALQLRAEAEAATIDPATAQIGLAIEAGKTASHQLRLTPGQEGFTEVTIRFRTAPDGAETVYSIPLLVVASGG